MGECSTKNIPPFVTDLYRFIVKGEEQESKVPETRPAHAKGNSHTSSPRPSVAPSNIKGNGNRNELRSADLGGHLLARV